MSEFGHVGIIAPGFCLDTWGAGPFVIEAGGKKFRFEDSDRFGPSLVNKRDKILNYPPEKSPFWRAHFLWVRQGRQLEVDGMTCIWCEPKPTLYRIELRGRQLHVITVEKGERDGLEIDVTPTQSMPGTVEEVS